MPKFHNPNEGNGEISDKELMSPMAVTLGLLGVLKGKKALFVTQMSPISANNTPAPSGAKSTGNVVTGGKTSKHKVFHKI